MDDIDLLKKYEPVLRFAKGERFFPMAVEPYLEHCMIFPSGPHGTAELFAHFNEPLIDKVGRLESHEYFLRFVNKPFYDFDIWIWWIGLSLLGIVAGWFSLGLAGVEIAVVAALMAALVIFMLASPIRLRIIPAVLAATLFCGLAIAPAFFFLHPSDAISLELEYLVLLPIYLLVLIFASRRVARWIVDHIVPEGPGLVMDMLSQATERVAQESYHQYREILEKHPQPVYYGRVVHEEDKERNKWTILQYHYFYAFNDWRLGANGMNHHEGDWEMTAVYLRNDKPFALLMSQHGAGSIEKWENVLKVKDSGGNETTHPIAYAALGSHANYSRPEIIRSPSMYKTGRIQRLLYWIDGVIHYLFMLFNPNQKARQLALKELQEKGIHFFDEDAFEEMKDETDHYVVSLPMEIATGDGVRIGVDGDSRREKRLKASDVLKDNRSHRETEPPKIMEWQCCLLNSRTGWLQYKGLWGVKSLLDDESGPPGPKWEKPRKNQAGVNERVRWGKPLEWLAQLERHKH